MTFPPRQLIGLHLRCRQVDRAALGLVGTALALRASHHWTTGTGLFAQLLLLLLTAAAASAIATSTSNPIGETEHTASSSLPVLRMTHLFILTSTAVTATTVAALTATYAISGPALLRNLAGFTGLALLAAALVGAHLAWVAPLGYVLYCGGELDLHISNLWIWPTLPAGDHTATLAALALLAAGLITISLAGARDRRTERS
jgi:hypothetical protein